MITPQGSYYGALSTPKMLFHNVAILSSETSMIFAETPMTSRFSSLIIIRATCVIIIFYKGHWWVMAVHALQGGCLSLHIETSTGPNFKDPFLCELYSVSVDYSSNCMRHIIMRYLTAILHLDHVAILCSYTRQNTIMIITLYYNAWQTKVILNSPIMVPGSAGSHSLLSFSFFLFFVYSRQNVHVPQSSIMDHSLHITAFHLRCDNCTAAG